MATYLFLAIGIIALVIACIQDKKKQAVYDIVMAVFAICCAGVASMRGDTLLGVISLSLCLLCLSLSDVSYMGGADTALLSGVLALLGPWKMPVYMLCFSSMAILIYCIETKLTHTDHFVKDKAIVLIPIMALAIPIAYCIPFGIV